MKKLFYGLLLFYVMGCRAQQVLPLNSVWDDSPNGSYFKDLSNELNQFVGTWHASFDGKTIKLFISKELQKPFAIFDKSFYKDELVVRYQILNSSGVTIHSTQNLNFTVNEKFKFVSVASRQLMNEVTLVYNGGACGVGLGIVSFRITSPTQFKWNYKVQPKALTTNSCPPGTAEPAIYLPTVENLIFTKQ